MPKARTRRSSRDKSFHVLPVLLLTRSFKKIFFLSSANGNALITTSGSRLASNNEAMTQQYNWSSPRSLAPAYKPTELHNQRNPPKLILDEESDIERRSIDSASVVNLDDDENLSDILNSDDEAVLRPSTGSSHIPQGIGNPGYTDEGVTDEPTEKENKSYNGKMQKNSTSPRLANGSARSKLSVSLDAEEKTVFLPVKNDKKNRQKDSAKQKQGKMLSPSRPERKVRRGSVTPLDEDDMKRKQSATESKKNKNSLTIQTTQDGGRRKSISTTDNEVLIVTPKEKYTKGKKNTKEFTFENGTKTDNEDAENPKKNKATNEGLATPDNGRRKSMINDVEDVQCSGKNGTKANDSLTVSAAKVSGRRKSLIADREGIKNSENDVKMNERLTTPVSERRKSLTADEKAKPLEGNGAKENGRSVTVGNRKSALAMDAEELTEGSGRNPPKINVESTTSVESTWTAGENTKRKKEKLKRDKKKKADDPVDLSDLEEATLASPKDDTRLNAIPATLEMKRRNSVRAGDKETKKKKKKRKEKETAKRKSREDSNQSDEDVEEQIKQINANSLDPEKTQRKKKKQKNATTTRRRAISPGAMEADEEMNEINGDFSRQDAINLKADSLPVRSEKKRKKSLILEDMESKSQSDEMETKSDQSLSPRGPFQEIGHFQSHRISPIPTGYKSPMLIIKPSSHKY